ncbi:hypothetical protein M514_26067 [Trichuris suis]|uniref:Secreted protein n=1 Tax=Trichuris suis TaxID=68888 RepID=A0A085MX25_9BILA|nr:hypothetical protein M514_26067 [Trichuris suis]
MNAASWSTLLAFSNGIHLFLRLFNARSLLPSSLWSTAMAAVQRSRVHGTRFSFLPITWRVSNPVEVEQQTANAYSQPALIHASYMCKNSKALHAQV